MEEKFANPGSKCEGVDENGILLKDISCLNAMFRRLWIQQLRLCEESEPCVCVCVCYCEGLGKGIRRSINAATQASCRMNNKRCVSSWDLQVLEIRRRLRLQSSSTVGFFELLSIL